MRWMLLTWVAALAAFTIPMSPAISDAATPLNCARASTIIGYTAAGRGVRVELLRAVTEPARVAVMLRRYGWDHLIGEADAVQLNYAVPSRYLLMASRRGCHLAHLFVEESEAKSLLDD